MVVWLGFETVPVRTTLSRRYKALYPVLQAFIAYLGRWAEKLSVEFDSCGVGQRKVFCSLARLPLGKTASMPRLITVFSSGNLIKPG